MRNLIVPAALAASLALGSAAFAATPQAHAAPHVGKQQACETTWKAQKSHTGTRAAFMKACIAKG